MSWVRSSSTALALGLIATGTVIAAVAAGTLSPLDPERRHHGVAKEHRVAMDRMMAAMLFPSSGDADRDFVRMMTAHHQGAIDMARLEILHGGNEQLRRIAQEIVVTQTQEIAAMRLALAEPAPPTAQPTTAAPRPVAGTSPSMRAGGNDRVYAAEQFSNTVSVIDPAANALLGVIRLGDPQPGNLSPLYRGQVLVHGMGFAPDHRTLVVVSVGSNAVTFIDTRTNAVKHTTYVGRSPHEAFFTPDGREVWVTVRGEDYVSVLDPATYQETARIKTPAGPGMTAFSPDGQYGYICSSFSPELVVVHVRTHQEAGRVSQPSPFCPNIVATADGNQVWYTLKDVGKVVVINARPPFNTLRVIDTGPITNHVNFIDTPAGPFAYVTVGGLNQVLVFRRGDFSRLATIPVGRLPHGIWPSGDGTRVYVGLENEDAMAAIDTASNTVIATIPIGQAPQAVVYVPGAVQQGDRLDGLQPLAVAGKVTHLLLGPPGSSGAAPTSVSLFDQGLIQVLQAAVTGLAPNASYVLALADAADGQGSIEPLAAFTTNRSGAAVVNATGPIRQMVQGPEAGRRRFLVIAAGTPAEPKSVVQRQR